MAKANMGRIIGILSAAATLTACQGLPGVPRAYTPTFKVEALPDSAAAVGSSAASPGVEVGGGAPAHAGKLVVQFGHLLPKAEARRLMATIADVETITITLSGNGVSHTETIPKAAIVNGATSFTFSGLPAGALTVTIKALNAANAVIGQDIQQATVTAGQTTVVTSTVTITPTIPTPRVIVGGSGGGSGGATGSLTTNVTLRDGIPVISPTIQAVHVPAGLSGTEFLAYDVVLDNQGNAWFASDLAGKLAKVTPADVLSYVTTPANHYWWWISVSPDGARILFPGDDLSANTVLGVNLDGSPAAAPAPYLGSQRMVQAPDGGVYYNGLDLTLTGVYPVFRMAPDGTVTTIFDGTDPNGVVAPFETLSDHASNVVFSVVRSANGDPASREVQKRAPDGTVVFNRAYAAAWEDLGIAVDSQNNVWVADTVRGILDKLSPTGQLLASTALPARANKLFVDATDRVWAYHSSKVWVDRMPIGGGYAATDVIARYDSAGVLQAYYQVGQDADTEEIAVSADDHLWVASTAKGLIHLKLDPLP